MHNCTKIGKNIVNCNPPNKIFLFFNFSKNHITPY